VLAGVALLAGVLHQLSYLRIEGWTSFARAPDEILDFRAVTIEARAEEIWPWLSQMGWHLGGYFTPHCVWHAARGSSAASCP
jgi:hypothetical protein